MSEIEKNFQLLKEVYKELRDMMHLKEDDIPSEAWEEKYDFLERLKEHYSDKITRLRWSELEETLRPLREEEKKERLRKENLGKNTYQHQHLKEQQNKNNALIDSMRQATERFSSEGRFSFQSRYLVYSGRRDLLPFLDL